MATTRLMPLHVGKGRDVSTAIADIIDYVENPQKTDFGKFIYGYECDTRIADAEFLLSKQQYKFCFHTPLLADENSAFYKETENRVSIFTNYPCIRQHATFDAYTSLCVELETERGNLLVYGTIIGIYGNRHPSFQKDLEKQVADLHGLARKGDGLCFSGDYNCSFADNYYFTKAGREILTGSLEKNGLCLLTKAQGECIDHIAVSKRFLAAGSTQVEEWNVDKRLSDHKGILVDF